MKSSLERYLATRAIKGPWQLAGCGETDFSGAVVIPALAESSHLFATLASLAANPAELLARFLIVVVVNQKADAPAADRLDNGATLARLATYSLDFASLRLAWVDAASPGRELPIKGGGVGLARRIGLDLALPRLAGDGNDTLLVSLDADTLVEPTYLPAIVRHFRETEAGGSVIPFHHRQGTTEEQAAIERYELFLRHYVLGLALASSPYAFHTVGSAMACTASAYVRVGGMNTRSAGEDFYFLQQLHRTGGVSQVCGTLVHPSPRSSHRVPFGTGRAVARALAEGEETVAFYRPECFALLGQWLALAAENPDARGVDMEQQAAAISPHLAAYLGSVGLSVVWDRLRQHSRDRRMFLGSFHGWFDAFKTLKLIHHLAAGPFPRCPPEETIPKLLQWAGMEPAHGITAQLALLRQAQNDPPASGPDTDVAQGTARFPLEKLPLLWNSLVSVEENSPARQA
jgi:hypothetical protein